jgi:chaperonin cofactor prefoldin
MDPLTTGIAIGATTTALVASASKLDTEKKLKEANEKIESLKEENKKTQNELRAVECAVVIGTIAECVGSFTERMSQKRAKEEIDRSLSDLERRIEMLRDRMYY